MIQYGKTSETTEEQYDNMMNVNVKAVFFLSKLIAPELIKTKGEGSLFFSFNTCRRFGLHYLDKATAATRAALPIPASVWGVLCVLKQ